MAFLDFHPLSPISTPLHTFRLISTMDSHTLVWHLELGGEWELNDEEVAAMNLQVLPTLMKCKKLSL